MGTNYYTMKKEPCPTCAHGGEDYHIGKSSAGWLFIFASYPEEGLTSKKAWEEFLKGRVIEDEYGRVVPYPDFMSLVENRQGKRHLYGDERGFEYLDDEGYRISTTRDFR